ncbi:uncharacterized protein [Montipora foliosa]|uniref:uncharacterized protein isoform X1 n=1 Tax=Montipora foliosa TaxID=591990 RepID=UPI0035F1671D
MSGKEKPGVTRRLNRGRSAHDSKAKTDSGCFVDEELERNGSSDSSQGSISSSPVKDTHSKKNTSFEKGCKTDSDHTPVPSPKPTIISGNGPEMVNDCAVASDKNENIVGKTQKASDFYCLYYSASPEGTLKIGDSNKVKNRPPVPPKPKTRRGSAPPSTFNNIERFHQKESDTNKRFSYSEYQERSSKPVLENSEDWNKRRSVEERVLFFEAFAQDGVLESSVPSRVQASSLMSLSDIQNDSKEDMLSRSENGLHNDLKDLERIPPLADSGDISNESNTDYRYEACNFSNYADHGAPLVEEEEFAVDGSNLHESTINNTPCENPHVFSLEGGCLDCDSKICDTESADYLAVDGSQSEVIISSNSRPEHVMDHLFDRGTRLVTHKNDVREIQPGFDCFDYTVPANNELQHVASNEHTSFGVTRQPKEDSHNSMSSVESARERRDSRGSLVNPRVNEIKQDLLIGSRQRRDIFKQRRPGSIAGISRSHFEKDLTSELKRRSWSVSEPQSTEINNYFVEKGHQSPSMKTNGSLEKDLTSPSVHYYHSDKTWQRRSSNQTQERSKWDSLRRPRPGSFDYSGYSSDDSSVHSEPLFQPLQCRPCISKGHIFKSTSVDSSIAAVGNATPCLDSIYQTGFRHSLGNRNPFYALRRQSADFGGNTVHCELHSQVQMPCPQALRRSSSNATCSSSSDSEVERIFNNSEVTDTASHQILKPALHGRIVTASPKQKITAMEALFGPQPSTNIYNTGQSSSKSERYGAKAPFEGISDFSPQPTEDGLLFEELAEEQETGLLDQDPREVEEPGLEFDDTDYSEFYTRCEDKDSLISAEAINIKKLLESPQTVLPDPDIESAVMTATERRVLSPPSDDKTASRSHISGNRISKAKDYDGKQCCESCQQHRGTQTPSADVFKALSPPPSVGTQTPPLALSQELLPSSLLKELQRDLQAPPPEIIRTMSPITLQGEDFSSERHFRAVSPSSDPFADTDTFSALQNNDRAVSVEELLQILANMKVGPPDDTPKQRPVSVQKYNTYSSSSLNEYNRSSTKSLPSSWHQLNIHTRVHDNSSEDFRRPKGTPPRSSKSYDCLRRGIAYKDKQQGASQVQANVERRGSREDIRQKLLEWRLRSQLFEEEVECSEERRKLAKATDSKIMKISFDGSEATDNIETESKLTRTHSLKRPRKDRAFSQRERSEVEVSSSVKKQNVEERQQQLNLCPSVKPDSEEVKENEAVQDGSIRSSVEERTFDLISDSLSLEKLQNAVDEPALREVASPEGIDIFIDYRKKNGLHITSTPKPPPYPGESIVCRDSMAGKTTCNKTVSENLNAEKACSVTVTEDCAIDVESQGDASSSSYSSDDDHFGEFGGSTDTVVFVDTEQSSGISLVPDLDSLDMKLGSNNQFPGHKTDNGRDDGHLDVLLGEVRRSLNLEFVDSDILDKAIEKFKQRVSPSSQYKALSSGLGMEACVALQQADELQGIISEIKGELKLLHDENDMLREQVVNLANQQTNGETTENSSTESAERLENLCKLYRPKQVAADLEDGEDLVEVDVCLTGFSVVPLGHLPAKKKEILLETVAVKGADWKGVMDAARKAFVDHVHKIDPDNYLGLGVHSIQGVQTGVIVWSPESVRQRSPRVELSQKSNSCVIQLKDGSHFSCDSLVYDTLLPKETIEKYVEQLLEHRYIVLCGEQGLGKSYLAAKLAEHVVQRIAWKGSPAVATFNVTQATQKELKQNLASLMQSNASSSQGSRPAVIVLDQLNCLASLADVFDLSVLEKNQNCPYIIGIRDKSRKGPFSSKELSLCHYFRWLRVSIKDRQYSGLLGRFLRRKLSWSRPQNEAESDDLPQLFNWLTKVWYHLNGILEEYCEADTTIGPSVFFSCPMDFTAAEGWFATVWNYNVIPYLHQALRSGRKVHFPIFDRCISWEDPTKWVVMRYPWNKDHSRVLHTLRKLRQIDVVLNRNYLGSDNVCFAECIQENEKILRAHSTVSKRVRTVVQQKASKRDSEAKIKTFEQMEFLRHADDSDSCHSESDSYLETSI